MTSVMIIVSYLAKQWMLMCWKRNHCTALVSFCVTMRRLWTPKKNCQGNEAAEWIFRHPQNAGAELKITHLFSRSVSLGLFCRCNFHCFDLELLKFCKGCILGYFSDDFGDIFEPCLNCVWVELDTVLSYFCPSGVAIK